jgi:hypothetical protein
MAFRLDTTREEGQAEEARLGKIRDTHRELSLLGDYPPFSLLDQEQYDKWVGDVTGINDDEDDPFVEVMQKWADEIAEARMYQKRYPGDSEAATQAAAKIQGG